MRGRNETLLDMGRGRTRTSKEKKLRTEDSQRRNLGASLITARPRAHVRYVRHDGVGYHDRGREGWGGARATTALVGGAEKTTIR